MKIVPQAFYQSTTIKKVMVANDCAIIHKKTNQADLDNHRLLSAHAITIVCSGDLMIHDDERLPLKVSPEEMVLLPKGLYAITDLIPKDQPFEAIVIFFNDDIVKEFLGQKAPENVFAAPDRNPSKFILNKSFKEYIDQTISLYSQMKPNATLVKNKLIEALHLISETCSDEFFLERMLKLRTHPKKELSRFMTLHFDKPLSVEQFANLSGRSVSSFRRDFREMFKISPKKWLIQKRLHKAETLLTQEKNTVIDAAISSGFTDIPHFIRSFNKHFQNTPKQYVLSQQRKNQSP